MRAAEAAFLIVGGVIAAAYIGVPVVRGVRESRLRRDRRRAGLPDTDHPVRVHDVRTQGDFEPYLVAICEVDSCGWMEFADAEYDPTAPSGTSAAEVEVRRKAAAHSSRVAPTLSRPVE